MSTETLAQALERALNTNNPEWRWSRRVRLANAAVLAHFGVGSEDDLTRAVAMMQFVDAEKEWVISRPESDWQVTNVNAHSIAFDRVRAAGDG